MYDIKLLYPVDMKKCTTTQRFGENPVDYIPYGILGHNGWDAGSYGGVEVPIHSVGRGVVTVAKLDTTGYGWRVDVVHTWGRSLYGHMKYVSVKVGQEVNAGDMLGIMDSTGNSSGTHLHLGIYPKDEPKNNGYNGAVDPMPYLTGEVPDDEPTDELPTEFPVEATMIGTPAIRLSPELSNNDVGRMKLTNKVKVLEILDEDTSLVTWTKVELWVAYKQGKNIFMEFKKG